ncbi:MAG: hypothetical protein GY749_03900 [Desulfobacteraceae bacterium]|nr:hypothetical protein [Desulfobacteraceae bacterium]
MISIELTPDIEKQFAEIVYNNYDGDVQRTITALLKLHKKYGWKEQLVQDVESVRAEVRKKGGIRAESIDNAIKKYRKSIAGDGYLTCRD